MANSLLGMIPSSTSADKSATSPMSNMQMVRQAAQSAKKMMGMLQSVKNPQQALMAAAQQNPQLNAVMQMCQGKDPQSVFYEQCKKQGVDPNTVISALKG